MIKDALPNARLILSEELKSAHWHVLTDPQKVFDMLDSCIDRTYKRMRSACWGDKIRTVVCDVMFKEVQASVALARSSMEALSVLHAFDTEKKEKETDWLQPILLLAAAALVLIGGVYGINLLRVLLSTLGALCVLLAFMREMS